ncbi:hypothetical protein ACHAXR_006317 [Thalassiosira sp. AJA248-18]
MSENGMVDSIGGSLLNDLLSDLNASVAANATQSNNNDRSDDLFALLEQELTLTYSKSSPHPPASLVVSQQACVLSSSTGSNDAWSTALSQFGSMSLAADFLAADTAKKQKQVEVITSLASGMVGEMASNTLFDEDEDYVLEGEVASEGQQRKTVAQRNAIAHPVIGGRFPEVVPTEQSSEAQKPEPPKYDKLIPFDTAEAPPLSPLFPSHPVTVGVMPPHPMTLNPTLMPLTKSGPEISSPQDTAFVSQDFPALGTNLEQVDLRQEMIERSPAKELFDEESIVIVTAQTSSDAHFIFNRASPNSPPIPAHNITTKFMSFKDLCYIVHVMLRPLRSLDTYNNDYYHWSVVNRENPNLSIVQRSPNGNYSCVARPNPVWKEVKVMAKENEDQFHAAVKTRAKSFAEEKRSLGHLVKANAKRPKALLNTPVLKKDNAEENLPEASHSDSKYGSELRRSRVLLWKARVSIDRGYSAFLSLIELRRLIQAHVGAPRHINELLVDVKTNVDLLHTSLGVFLNFGRKGDKEIEIDKWKLAVTLSMPKGRVLCARVIEEGILPHPSACHILPVALCCIFSWPMPAVEGEERLLHALTVLVQTPQPSIHPLILCRCLELSILGAHDNKDDLLKAARCHVRMELMHAILSTGKIVCVDAPFKESWCEKEKTFLKVLEGVHSK